MQATVLPYMLEKPHRKQPYRKKAAKKKCNCFSLALKSFRRYSLKEFGEKKLKELRREKKKQKPEFVMKTIYSISKH